MSNSSLVAMPHQPYRVSSRSALTSPKPPHCANGTASRLPRLASQKSMDVLRHYPSRTQNHAIQTTQAGHAAQLPQLLPSKPASIANAGFYGKLKTIKSFFKRHTADSDDDSHEGFDTGRGADPSTNSEPAYTRSNICHREMLYPSPAIHSASHRRGLCPPTLAESFGWSKESSRSRPSGVRTEHNQQRHPGAHRKESELKAYPLPNGRSSRPHSPANFFHPSVIDPLSFPSARSPLEDSTLTKSYRGPRKPRQTSEGAGAGPQPNSRPVISKPSITRVPDATSFSELCLKQDSLRRLKAQPIEAEKPAHHHPPTFGKSGASSSSKSVDRASDLEEGVNYSDGDSSEEENEELECDTATDDITGESFEINEARELKPATACKLVLTEPEKSTPALSVRVSSAGSSARSSSSFGDFCGGMSPCCSSSLPSPKSLDGEDYINIHQIRHVIRGLTCLLEKLDPQDELPDPLHRTPSNQPSSHLNHHVRLKINHAEFFRMIKQDLGR